MGGLKNNGALPPPQIQLFLVSSKNLFFDGKPLETTPPPKTVDQAIHLDSMPCFWWAPFRSFGVSGVISARVGIRTYFRCHRKSFKLQKGSKRLHLLHRNQIIFCCDHLSQAAKDHEKKDSKHERRDTNKPHECHKQYHDIGHTD